MTKISVCVTTYNREKLLDQTLRSLFVQTRQPDELIVSDDCSTDGTRKVVEKWKHKFPQLRYNRSPVELEWPGIYF